MARVVAQRVRSALVTVDGRVVGEIERGLVLFVGIEEADEGPEVDRVADKVAVMRVFEDEDGKMRK